MKYFPLLLLLLSPVSASAAYYVQAYSSKSTLSSTTWIEVQDASQIVELFRTVDPQVTGLVVGGGLLLWGVGCGVGMYLQSARKLR